MDRLSPLDASFLYIEDDGVSHMHIASVAIFEGPSPGIDAVRRMVAGHLPLVPRYRQKVRTVPLDLGRPVWVDDPHFNLEYHVRHTALPSPGGDEELRNLVGRVMSQRLDRSRPLWEMWMVEGMTDDRWAIFSKSHHCMVDGVSGTDLLTIVLDRDPNAVPPPGDDWRPAQEPSAAELAARAVRDLALTPYEQLRALRSAAQRPRRVLQQAGVLVQATRASLGLVAPSSARRALNGPIGPHRRYTWARSNLGDVKTVRGAFGGTVNDVVLAAITRGFRDLLLSRGEDVSNMRVRTLVPVSVRTEDARGIPDNRVSGMIARLPVGIEDPLERLATIKAQMEGLKSSGQAVGGEVLTNLTGFAPSMMLALGERVAARLPQQVMNTVTTNVPGPRFSLYAAGRKMVEAFPYVPLGGNVRIGVAIFSYTGQLNFGITGDYDTAPDISVLADGIEAGMGELVKLADVPEASRPAIPDRRGQEAPAEAVAAVSA